MKELLLSGFNATKSWSSHSILPHTIRGRWNQHRNFLNHFQRMASHPVEPKSIIDAWNAMLIGWQRGTLQNLEELEKKYNVFLLSNINELHLFWIQNDLKRKSHSGFWIAFFNRVYYSHLIGMRKPRLKHFSLCSEWCKVRRTVPCILMTPLKMWTLQKGSHWQSILHPTNEDVFRPHQYLTLKHISGFILFSNRKTWNFPSPYIKIN